MLSGEYYQDVYGTGLFDQRGTAQGLEEDVVVGAAKAHHVGAPRRLGIAANEGQLLAAHLHGGSGGPGVRLGMIGHAVRMHHGLVLSISQRIAAQHEEERARGIVLHHASRLHAAAARQGRKGFPGFAARIAQTPSSG